MKRLLAVFLSLATVILSPGLGCYAQLAQQAVPRAPSSPANLGLPAGTDRAAGALSPDLSSPDLSLRTASPDLPGALLPPAPVLSPEIALPLPLAIPAPVLGPPAEPAAVTPALAGAEGTLLRPVRSAPPQSLARERTEEAPVESKTPVLDGLTALGTMPRAALFGSTKRWMEGASGRSAEEADSAVALLPGSEGSAAGLVPAQNRPGAVPASEIVPGPDPGRPQYSSPLFSALLAAVSASALALALLIPMAITRLAGAPPVGFEPAAPPWWQPLASGLAVGLGVVTASAVAYALWEFALFVTMGLTGKKGSEEEVWRASKDILLEWDLHPSVISTLLGPKPGRGVLRSSEPGWHFAYTLGSGIYLNPALARTPWLLRRVLKHELRHYLSDRERGPPRPGPKTWLGRLWRFLSSETLGRAAEWRSESWLLKTRIPALERVLHDTQLSLRLGRPFDVLIVNPQTSAATDAASAEGVAQELRNPASFAALSEGQARVMAWTGEGPQHPGFGEFFASPANQNRFRYAVLPRPFDALPAPGTEEYARMTTALEQIGQIYRLSLRLRTLGAKVLRRHNSPELRELHRLSVALGVPKSGRMTHEKLDSMISELYFRVARRQLQGIGLVSALEGFYRGLRDGGVAFLPFDPGDPGLDAVERLVRHWQAEDGGAFSVRRVDLPEGGHVLVATKDEPRVNLWLRPQGGRRLAATRSNVAFAPETDQAAILQEAGFSGAQIERFRQAGLEVAHVFGNEEDVPDIARNRIFVSVSRSHAKALRRYAESAGIGVEFSREDNRTQLLESIPLHKVEAAWRSGFDGRGMRAASIDTGLDKYHEDFLDRSDRIVVKSFVRRAGPDGDPLEHGTHKSGIIGANGRKYKGTAPQSDLWMGKVFEIDGRGAASADIMAAALEAMKWGADGISLSLGSPGTVDAELAVFFSQLSQKKNSRGHRPFISASAGNSGPFFRTSSAPGVGKYVFKHGAATKKKRVPFYLSWGFALDKRYDLERERLPFGNTPSGGDVATVPGNPDVYAGGVEATKAAEGQPSPSDTADRKHRRMSGSSMGEPMDFGIVMDVKQAVMGELKAGTASHEFFMDNMPFALGMIAMASSEDLGVPLFVQEGGFPSAEEAVKLARRSFADESPRIGARLGRLLPGRAKAGAPSWDWIRRIKILWELEDKVFDGAQEAKRSKTAELERGAALPGNPDAPREDEKEDRKSAQRAASAAQMAMVERFDALRQEVLPSLLEALKDRETWLIRMYAAYILRNLRTLEALTALAEAAFSDPDARVRQAAFLAIARMAPAELEKRVKKEERDRVFSALKGAAAQESSERPDVALYSAYALAQLGDASGLPALLGGARHPDDRVRYTSLWMLGQLGPRAQPAAADALADRIGDADEEGNNRHLAVASLTEIASAVPTAVTDKSILSLLQSAGPQNLALTRTIAKFFPAAARSASIRKRMLDDGGVLKPAIVEFINTHKAAVNRPGALGEMVALLAEILDIPLDLPTPVSDPDGAGVSGVDPNLGPIHLIVELPRKSKARIPAFADYRGEPDKEAVLRAVAPSGLEPALLKFYSAEPQAALPLSNAVWVNIPDAKVTAFTAAVEAQGFRVHRARPKYKQSRQNGPPSPKPEAGVPSGGRAEGTLVTLFAEGLDPAHPAIAPGRVRISRNFTDEGTPGDVQGEGTGQGTFLAGLIGSDLAAAKVLGAHGGSDAQVMAAMEWKASLAQDPLQNPEIFLPAVSGPGSAGSPLSRLANRLMLMNILVLAPAGNDGAAAKTGSPASAALSIVVGALDKAGAPMPYSTPAPAGKSYAWMDFGGGINPFEVASLLSTRLAKDLVAADGEGPLGTLIRRAEAALGPLRHGGYALWLAQLLRDNARRVQGRRGLQVDMAKTLAALDEALRDPPGLAAEAETYLYQTGAGTDAAAAHSADRLSELVRRMKEKMGRLPDGYALWLARLVRANGQEVAGRSDPRIDLPRALAALEDALKDPGKVAAESEALVREARKTHGLEAPAPAPRGRRIFRGFAGLWGRLLRVWRGLLRNIGL